MGEKFSDLRGTDEKDLPPLTHFHPLDEASDFHDPYSDLNLFLTRQIKEEFKETGVKKWSIYLQEKLITKIGPEFRKKFPHYRLGVAALKKVWEKIAYYSQTFESQKEALTPDGHLDLHFLIRENLKQFFKNKKKFPFHPYLLAQQVALKISECLAAYDGIRPMLQHMTKLIWAVERHLIPPQQIPALANPYEECDSLDKLILKFMLEALGKNPQLSQEELQRQVRLTLQSLDAVDEETIHILIDNPHLSPIQAFETASLFFKKAAALVQSSNWVEIEHKITLWTIQGDLVYRLIRIERNPLLDLITSHESRDITQLYISLYPSLTPFAPSISSRVTILTRYAWYSLLSSPEQSTFDRFLEWHQSQGLSTSQIEDLCKSQLPLLPSGF